MCVALRQALVGCSLLALLAGCRSGAAASANLDVLMDGEDNLRHVAPLQTAWRYNVRQLVPRDTFKDGSLLGGGVDPVAVGDPSYRALKELIELRDGGGFQNDTARELNQVRQYARYAMRCPGRLARERALLELAPHAQRLGVRVPYLPPELRGVDPATQVVANAPELAEALRGLVEAALPVISGDRGDTALTDLAAACDVVAALELDLDGLWRAMRGVGTLTGRANFDDEPYHALRGLAEDLQRRAARRALAFGLQQELDPVVRAAAIRANHAVFGEPFLREAVLWLRLTRELEQPFGPTFGVAPVLFDEDPIYVTTLGLVQEHGLPLEPELGQSQRILQRIRLLETMVGIAQRHQVYEDRPRTAAVLALSAVADQDPPLLRYEDWLRWWRAVRPAEVEAYRALVPEVLEPGTGNGDPTP